MNEISEVNNISETDDRREIIKQKLHQYYDSRIVRKDLTKSIREGANVPVYALEYLLGNVPSSKESYMIIDKITVVLNTREDRYEATFSVLCIKGIPIHPDYVKDYDRLLCVVFGVFCSLIMNLSRKIRRIHSRSVLENLHLFRCHM